MDEIHRKVCHSDNEDDIPLMELAKRLKARDQHIKSESSCEEDMDAMSDHSSQDIHIDEVTRVKKTKQTRSKKNVETSEKFLDVMRLLLEGR